jgi:6-phosphogluconolactonase/glucosamine-6-phosphate isomerase/deaminase
MYSEYPLNILVVNPENFNRVGISLLGNIIQKYDDPGIILPVGNTVSKIYEGLGKVKFKYVQLDEIAGTHLFRDRIAEQLLRPVGLDCDLETTFNGMAKNLETEAARMETAVTNNPPRLCVLGIGRNGHIGYNEPGSSLDSKTRVVRLTEESRKSLQNYWPEKNIDAAHGLTLGLSTIRKAQSSLLLVNYDLAKSEAVKQALFGAVKPECGGVPAAAIRLFREATVLIDRRMWNEVNSGETKENKKHRIVEWNPSLAFDMDMS